MNTFNKLCMITLFIQLTSSLQFDPAPREGEPQVSRRTPGTTILDSCLFQTTSSKCIPLYCRSPHLLGECLKRGEWKFIELFLFTSSFFRSICNPTLTFN